MSCRLHEHVGGTFLQLPLPFDDPVRAHIELLRQFGWHPFARERRHRHFRFESL